MEKIKTGIIGLDKILKGGLNKGSSILVTGAPGTGKTILALQFILEGAKNGEPGLYITSEETVDSLKNYTETLGLDLTKYKNLITITTQPSLQSQIISLRPTIDLIKKKKIKRVVLDSLTLFEYVYSKNELEFRRGVLDFILKMKKSGATLLATAEKSTTNLDVLEYRPQDFLFEGLIILTRIRRNSSFERCIHVAKMRGQDHLIDIFPIKIEKGGVQVFPEQIPFSLVDKEEN